MSCGSSGRVVVEVDPALKKRLYAALSLDGTTLKHWFLQRVDAYLAEHKGLADRSTTEPGARSRTKGRHR